MGTYLITEKFNLYEYIVQRIALIYGDRYVIENKEVIERAYSLVCRKVYDMLMGMKEYHQGTFYHCVDTSINAFVIANGIPAIDYKIDLIVMSGLLHDIGKTHILVEILDKTGKLTDEEWKTITSHSRKGYEILKDLDWIPDIVKMAVLEHHEKIDGSGYPIRSFGYQLSEFTKIITVADIFSALTAERSYHSSLSPLEALNVMRGMPVELKYVTRLDNVIRRKKYALCDLQEYCD